MVKIESSAEKSQRANFLLSNTLNCDYDCECWVDERNESFKGYCAECVKQCSVSIDALVREKPHFKMCSRCVKFDPLALECEHFSKNGRKGTFEDWVISCGDFLCIHCVSILWQIVKETIF